MNTQRLDFHQNFNLEAAISGTAGTLRVMANNMSAGGFDTQMSPHPYGCPKERFRIVTRIMWDYALKATKNKK